MKKYTRVFQIKFDIAETSIHTQQDREDLCNEITQLINEYCDIKGKPLNFLCVNGENSIEDMSHCYGDTELGYINLDVNPPGY